MRQFLKLDVVALNALSGRGELRNGTQRSRFRGLSARVRVDPGIEHQNVHVPTCHQDMIEPTEPAVVSLAVASHDPNAAPDNVIHNGEHAGLAVSSISNHKIAETTSRDILQ